MSTRRTSSPSGSLAEHGPSFHNYLFELGYLASAATKLTCGCWRSRQAAGVNGRASPLVSTEGVFRRRAQGGRTLRTPRSLDPLRASLRQLGVIETRSSAQRVSATAESLGPLSATRGPPRLPRRPVIMPTVSPAAIRPDQPRRPPTRRVVGIIAGSA